ncbi:MAG: Gfo/Idh/MocA family protein [Geminicoccaceae bacterium]
MTKRKIAIIGLGKISLDQHVPVIEGGDDFELAAVVSQRGLSHQNAPSFKTPAELFRAMPEIDVVAVNTPPGVRHAIAREALDHRKEVLLEKPPAATVTEIDDLKAHAESLDRVLFSTWHSQFNPAVERARTLLSKSGVRSLRIEWREDVRKWHPGQDWVWEAGGFGVFDPGINALSILVHALPFTAFVKKAALTYPANRQTPITAKLAFSSTAPSAPTLCANFDWREQGQEIWQMLIETADGQKAKLFKGGRALEIDDQLIVDEPNQEYQRIYARFSELLDQRQSDVDDAPLRLVADAMLVGERHVTDAFSW